MKHKNNASQITKLTHTTTKHSKNIAAKGLKKASELQHSVEKRLGKALQRGTDTLVEQLTNPKNAAFLQGQLARIAQLGFTLGFKIDPNAEQLYNFVQWIENRHGQKPVMSVVFSQNLLADGQMIQLLTTYASYLGSPAGLRGKDPDWKANDIEQFKKHAGKTLLNMLCELVALEHDQPLPDTKTSERIAYFESAPIPEEFHPLAAMATGKRPDLIVMPGQKPKQSDDKRPSRLNRLTQSILESAQKALGENDPQANKQKANKQTGLARFIPGLNDPTFHFIVFSYTFFLETYMMRNLIENLPGILENLGPLPQSDEFYEQQYNQTDYTDPAQTGQDPNDPEANS